MSRQRTSDLHPLSPAAAFRLSQYLRCIPGSALHGMISSRQLATLVGVSDAQVRRDLAALGHLGRRGVGYIAEELTQALRATLGIDRRWLAVLVGVGNLARALLRYQGFKEQGFEIVGLFDNDPAKVHQSVDGLPIWPMTALPAKLKQLKPELGVLTLPAPAAQAAANMLCAGGVHGLLNFAPAIVHVPPHVSLVSVDLSVQFEQLAFLVTQRKRCLPSSSTH